jgi:lipoyl(octanoyl) transferase
MIEYVYLGRVAYDEALRLQAEMAALRLEGRVGNVLLLLEHPPVLTLGRNAKRENILASDELLAAQGVTLYEINRGGDVTYHGPGQLVGYPVFDLRSLRNPASGARLGPVDFVRLMEGALIRLCGEFGVQAERICGLTGVWSRPAGSSPPGGGPAGGSPLDERCGKKASDPPAGEKKIAAIGIHVARGITTHGFAFNVTTDLSGFALINPCGITDRPVTSLALETTGPETIPDMEALAHRAARQFGVVFEEPVQAVESLETLRVAAQAKRGGEPQSPMGKSPDADFPAREFPAAEFPGNDAPLEIPAEIERLRQKADRPIRA